VRFADSDRAFRARAVGRPALSPNDEWLGVIEVRYEAATGEAYGSLQVVGPLHVVLSRFVAACDGGRALLLLEPSGQVYARMSVCLPGAGLGDRDVVLRQCLEHEAAVARMFEEVGRVHCGRHEVPVWRAKVAPG